MRRRRGSFGRERGAPEEVPDGLGLGGQSQAQRVVDYYLLFYYLFWYYYSLIEIKKPPDKGAGLSLFVLFIILHQDKDN